MIVKTKPDLPILFTLLFEQRNKNPQKEALTFQRFFVDDSNNKALFSNRFAGFSAKPKSSEKKKA